MGIENIFPVYGLVITSFPHFYHPTLCNSLAISLTNIYANGVASLNCPLIEANFDDKHSIKWPTFIKKLNLLSFLMVYNAD